MSRADGGDTAVLRLITRLNIGGPAQQALLLSRALSDEFPTLLAAGTPSQQEGEMSDPAVRVVPVPLVRPIRPQHDIRALEAVRGLLRRTSPRILHTHMAKAGLVGRLAALTMRQRPRLVHTFHGHVLSGYFSQPVQRAFLELERRLARHTDVLVAVSTEVRDSLLELGVGRPEQYRVVPLGFDLSRFLSVEGHRGTFRDHLGVGPRTPLVGVVGRLVPIKNHVLLLQAMAHLPDAHLAIVGDGELRHSLEARASASGLADRVHFTGWWPKVPEALSDLDVVALSSRNEGTPVALIEALAAGRPVVATDVGGVRSVVDDGESGFLTSKMDSAEMARKIQQLLDDEVLRCRMGERGRQHVREVFGAERLVEDIRQLYRELEVGG